MRRRYVGLGLAAVIAFIFLVPVMPVGAAANPLPCGPMGAVGAPAVTCRATSVYLVSPLHALFGVGGYFWELSGNGTIGYRWHYGFDV